MPVNNRRFRDRITELIHVDRHLIGKEIRKIEGQVSGVLLDVGCGKQPYRNELRQVKKYIGLDRVKNADIVHDLPKFPYPLEAGAADWILCTQVLDDLPDQDAFIRELHRLLAAKGGLILSVSFVWELHDLPHDYGRPSPEQLRLLLGRNGFEIVELQNLGNSWTTLGQVININMLNIVSKHSWWFMLISPLLLMSSLFFYGVGSLCHSRQAERLPLGFFVVARKQ
jgi:SAM-dependent methyltransferase